MNSDFYRTATDVFNTLLISCGLSYQILLDFPFFRRKVNADGCFLPGIGLVRLQIVFGNNLVWNFPGRPAI
jgi:hypothetical protein